MSLAKTVGIALTGIGGIIMAVLGVAIYIWSIVIAYLVGGIVAAAITIAIPVISQLYWFFKIWYWTGNIYNPYCLALIGYIIAWIVMLVGIYKSES